MPTMLGNVLRRSEDSAGHQFNLDIIQIVPYLVAVAPGEQTAYLSGAREEMDTAISLTAAGLLATVVTVGLLIFDRGWLLLALMPYTIAYLAYRGAVAAAEEYGTALSVLVSLSRFELYERLHLDAPETLADEKRSNRDLAYLLGADDTGTTTDHIRFHKPNVRSPHSGGT